jgi:hypothetical protein
MADSLLVPIHLHALRLTEPLSVADPGADFSELPWFDGQRDVSPGTPFLGESVTDLPFDNRELRLGPGIHLHWALPDALTRESGGSFPPVPDRWLVTRRALGDDEPVQWVVESNYLYPPGHPGAPESIAWPMPLSQPGAGQPPFRRCGRRLPVKLWGDLPATPDPAQYLPEPLTALGWGDPTFHAMYPTCRGVFGLHDEYTGPLESLGYEVLGWYSNPAHDPLQRLRAGRPDATVEELLAAMAGEYDWDAGGAGALPDGIVCHARITFTRPEEPPLEGDGLADVSVGNTGVEALSAQLAAVIAPANQRRVEDQLEAAHLGQRLERHPVADGPAKFLEARHEKGFVAVDGGTRWSVLPQGTGTAGAGQQGAQAALPPAVARRLHEVNTLQDEHDRAFRQVEGLRHRLFADWCRYLHCAHPPAGGADPLPDADEVRDYLERRALPRLEAAQAACGTLALREEDHGRRVAGAEGTPAGSLAARLAAALAELLGQVDALNHELAATPAGTSFVLARSAAPRFWAPTEPVVLVSGSDVEPSLRHGHDGRLREDGRLGCRVLAGLAPAALLPDWAQTVSDLLDAVARESGGDRIGFEVSDGRPWNPLLLEWAVELFPVRGGDDAHPSGTAYPADYLTRGYTLPDGAPYLALAEDRVELTRGANVYRGTAILTPHACVHMQRVLVGELARLVKPRLLAAFYEDAAVPPAERNERGVVARRDELNGWLATQDHAFPRLPAPDAGDTRSALEQVDQWLGDAYSRAFSWIVDYTAPFVPLFVPEPVPVSEHWFMENVDGLLARYDQTAARMLADMRADGTAPPRVEELRAALAALKDDVQLVVLRAALLRLEDAPCLAQALSGFNEALRMRRQSYQLPVADPLAFAGDEPFVERMRAAVAGHNRSSPQPGDDFNPIRAGALELLGLRLVDSFGQVRDLRWNEVTASEPLAPGATRHPVLLPPRVVQPMRLDFRWLAADSDHREMGDHPDTSPVCGWLLANHLDGTLVVYDADGAALGSLSQSPDEPWQPAPGTDRRPTVESIPSPVLRRVVRALLERQRASPDPDTTFLDDFLEVVDGAQDRIEPDPGAQHAGMALLVGRPLAVVRATLGLELRDPPAVHQGWSAFRHDMRRVERDTHRFEHVRFPVRVGEHGQLNDGVVGFWIEDGAGGFADARFFSPAGDVPDGPWFAPGGTLPPWISPSPAGPARTLCLLVDPRGVVHATSGVSPVKTIDIPAHQYQPALRAMEVTFLTTPLLTDRGTVRVTLPDEPGLAWSWLERGPAGWDEWTTHGVVSRSQLLAEIGANGPAVWRQLLDLEWITPIEGERAAIASPDRRAGPALPEALAMEEPRVEALFARLQVTPFQGSATFAAPQEIREGWLRLRNEPTATPQP